MSFSDYQLLNLIQKDFPITDNPFAEIAKQLDTSEEVVIQKLQGLKEAGKLSRLGAVFNHKKAGASTLVGMAVPPTLVEKTAEKISRLQCVNHNYLREHEYNLWFVVTAPCKATLAQVMTDLQFVFPFPLLDLPMTKGFFIDLAFPLLEDSECVSDNE